MRTAEEALREDPITLHAMKVTGLGFDEIMKVRIDLPDDPLCIESTLVNLTWISPDARENIGPLRDFAILRWYYSPESRLPEFEEMSLAASTHILLALQSVFAERDMRRQAGTRKERRPEITQWIKRRLAGDPSAKSPELWANAPDWITDDIGYERFSKRVTAARKTSK